MVTNKGMKNKATTYEHDSMDTKDEVCWRCHHQHTPLRCNSKSLIRLSTAAFYCPYRRKMFNIVICPDCGSPLVKKRGRTEEGYQTEEVFLYCKVCEYIKSIGV